MVWTTRKVDRVSQPFSAGDEACRRAIEIDVEADRRLRRQLTVEAAAQRVAWHQEIGDVIAVPGGGAFEAQPQAALEDLLLSAAGELEKRTAAAALQLLVRVTVATPKICVSARDVQEELTRRIVLRVARVR